MGVKGYLILTSVYVDEISVKGRGSARSSAQNMKQKLIRLLMILLLATLFSVVLFADDTRFFRDDAPNKRFVGPNGVYMMLSQYNNNFTHEVIQSFESELAVFTPEFDGKIRTLSSARVCIFVVRDNKVTQIIKNAGAPRIPEDGYLVVGHGRAAEAFMTQFKVGDEVFVVDYTPVFREKEYPEAAFLADDSVIPIEAWNKGRRANEVLAYNSDYADKTYNNQYGVEIVIVEDEVIHVRAYDTNEICPIPEDGFVISTHGSRNPLIIDILIGDFVEIAY